MGIFRVPVILQNWQNQFLPDSAGAKRSAARLWSIPARWSLPCRPT